MIVAEVIAKLKEVGLTFGAEKTHWTSHPKIMDTSIEVDGLAMLWEEVLEFVGSKVCLDGRVRNAIAHRSAQANKRLANWRPVSSSSWLPRKLRLSIVNSSMWQAFLWSLKRVNEGERPKRQIFELECENGGERDRSEEAPRGWKWISGGGFGTGLAKNKWAGPHPKRFKIYRLEDMVSTEVSKVCGNADGFAEPVQLPAEWLHFERIVGNGGSSQKLGKARPRRCDCDDTVGLHLVASGVQARLASWWKDF